MAISNTTTYTATKGDVTILAGGSYGPPAMIARSNLRNDLLVAGVAQEFRERLAAGAAIITGASAADPVVITVSTGHDFQNQTLIQISGVVGMVELNGGVFSIANRTATTFELQDGAPLGSTGSDVDGSGFTAYSSGGAVTLLGIAGTATLSLG